MRHFLSCCLFAGLCCQSSAVAADGGQRVSSVQLKMPDIVIRGAHLSRVEVWALPTGTGLGDQHLVFGTAERKGAAGAGEIWVLRLPRCAEEIGEDYLAAQIVAVGFDSAGAEVGRHELEPSLGAIELYKTLCAR